MSVNRPRWSGQHYRDSVIRAREFWRGGGDLHIANQVIKLAEGVEKSILSCYWRVYEYANNI